jgi:C-terminal processing protease CtpA/Prc
MPLWALPPSQRHSRQPHDTPTPAHIMVYRADVCLGQQRFHGRVVLMVNEHTASAGEMVSAFAEENKRECPPCLPYSHQ